MPAKTPLTIHRDPDGKRAEWLYTIRLPEEEEKLPADQGPEWFVGPPWLPVFNLQRLVHQGDVGSWRRIEEAGGEQNGVANPRGGRV